MVERGSQRTDSSLSGLTRTDEEVVDETSLESFPASDPPAWVFGRDRTPPPVSEDFSSLLARMERIPVQLLERALSALRNLRCGRDVAEQ
jgi:hypothetical protein